MQTEVVPRIGAEGRVEGSLTTDWRAQHPGVEPASVLLERILTERRRRWEDEQLVRFKAKGQSPPTNWRARYEEPVGPDTTVHPILPPGWCSASFDQIGQTQGGLQKTPDRRPQVHHVPYLRVANVLRGALDLTELHRFEVTRDELTRLRLALGDLLVVEGNGSRSEIGRSALWQGEVEDCIHQNHIIRVRPLPGADPRYLNIFVNSPVGQAAIQRVASSTSGLYTLSVTKIRSLVLPLPPLEEQEAIVEITDEQLSVIAHLESDLVARLESAQSLRQTILRAAFSGQLVSQDPNEEPASELLKRIVARREEQAAAAEKAKANGSKTIRLRAARRRVAGATIAP